MTPGKWPAWHAGNQLHADDLLALEDYLLTRVHLAEDGAAGVDGVANWTESIRQELVEGKRILKVGGVEGVTPAGQPVHLSAEDPLICPSWDGDELNPGDLFDLGIRVNSREKDAAKLTLIARPMQSTSERADIPSDFYNANTLYLGRYRIPRTEQAVPLTMEYKPRPRRFCGFGPVGDPAWRGWVNPLADRLENLLRGVEGSASPVSVELARLAWEWPLITVPALTRRLRMVHWLVARQEKPGLAPDFAAALDPADNALDGNDLPAALARLLPESTRSLGGLKQSLPALLGLLADGVSWHAPIGLLRQWTEDLQRVRTGTISQADQNEVRRIVEASLGKNPWPDAVAYITCGAIGLAAGGNTPVDAAVRSMSLLYPVAGKAPAGPMAYYWLASAAAQVPGFATSSSPPVSTYLVKRDGQTEAGRKPSFGGMPGGMARPPQPMADSMSRFLNRRSRESLVTNDIKPLAWRGDSRNAAPQDSACIVVVGAARCGKTTLIRQMLSTGGTAGLTTPGAQGELTGRVAFSGRGIGVRAVEIELSESRATGSWGGEADEGWQAAAGADLVVLAIDPHGVDAGRAGDLLRFARWMHRTRPGTSVALTFTKADEYGVVDAKALRFVETRFQCDALANFRQKNGPKEWMAFVGGANQATQETDRRSGGTVIFVKDRSNESAATRAYLIKATEDLWKDPAFGAGDAFLNAYFVAADSNEQYLANMAHSGVIHMLADFLGPARGGKG